MIGGYLEPGFPLYYVNDFLLSYLGYTYDEFNRAINGMVINCIHPDDRKAVDEQVAKAFSEGSAYEIQYRMKKKNGDYIWVNDIGKKGLSEDGRKVCISVIRDISLEVESREGLERQARRYNHLFESVLCGIVQYRRRPRESYLSMRTGKPSVSSDTRRKNSGPRRTGISRPLSPVKTGSASLKRSRPPSPGDKSPYEYRLLQKGGTPLWIIGSAEVILDIDGEQVIQSVFLDIDSRKRAELSNRRLSEQARPATRFSIWHWNIPQPASSTTTPKPGSALFRHAPALSIIVRKGMAICPMILPLTRWIPRIMRPSIKCMSA